MIAIGLLGKIAFKVLKDYENQRRQGKNPVFNPTKLGIKHADAWIEDETDKEGTEKEEAIV